MVRKPLTGDEEELERARKLRLKAHRELPMNERLARVHALSKQMSALKGAAQPR